MLKTKYFLKKSSKAPFVYFSLQLFILGVYSYTIPLITDFTQFETIILWIINAATFAIYLLTYFRDPGYIPLENLDPNSKQDAKRGGLITENRNATSSRKTLHTFQNLTINSSNMKTSGDKDYEKDSATILRKYITPLPNNKNQNKPEKVEDNHFQILDEINKPDDVGFARTNRDIDIEDENKQHKNSIIDDPDHPALKCEASLDNINSSVIRYEIKDHSFDESPKISAKFLEVKEDDNMNSKEEFSKNKKKQEDENLLNYKSKQSTNISTNCYSLFDSESNSLGHPKVSSDSEIHQQKKTDKNSAEIKKSQMSPLARNQNKENSNHQNQEQNMVLINVNCNKPFADDKLASDEIEKDKIEEFYFAEKRYCTVCNVEQPLRSKHCKDCRRCVALYDHHCPWTGNCVGEKNRCFFYTFLIFQLFEIAAVSRYIISWFMSISLTILLHLSLFSTILFFIAIVFHGFFGAMVTMLLCYHSYLILKNMTTWENVSWSKISYLKDWPEHYGSPFSMGIIKNIKYFLSLTFTNEIKIWKIPKFEK